MLVERNNQSMISLRHDLTLTYDLFTDDLYTANMKKNILW